MITTLDELLSAMSTAPLEHKRDFVRARVEGKDVLDIGCVAHSLARCTGDRERWLHHTIKTAARSVLGVDILSNEISGLATMGYNMICADALTLRLERTFDVVVCGDLIEHVTNPGALLDTINVHLNDTGVALITTPNPFSASRFFNILADGWTAINKEHTFWLCPQTMLQMLGRSSLQLESFVWLTSDFPMPTFHRLWGKLLNPAAKLIAAARPVFRNDYGVVVRKKI
ncbi:MAG: hypothetical protein A2219_02240 [Elusimicrobia bacterium RIFOXYA2_FULL_50_26]|nr:MAG: hypothetical protein A2219_02240 [Elusimicrobia bacterium RIFOXYA2_FULL_50_26]